MAGDPKKKRDDEGTAWFWKLRMGLELLKTGIWVAFQWVRPGGPFGPGSS